jgi:hypothetical protein
VDYHIIKHSGGLPTVGENETTVKIQANFCREQPGEEVNNPAGVSPKTRI